MLAAGRAGGARLANLLWTAKEAAAKARGEGLRLDVRQAVVSLEWDRSSRRTNGGRSACAGSARAVTAHGWWREEPGWVFAFVSEPPTPAPVHL